MDPKVPGVVVFVKFEVPKEQLSIFIEFAPKLVEGSRNEPGCLRYEMDNLASNPLAWNVYEEYKDKAAFDAHLETEHFKTTIGPYVPDLVKSGKWKLVIYEVKGAFDIGL